MKTAEKTVQKLIAESALKGDPASLLLYAQSQLAASNFELASALRRMAATGHGELRSTAKDSQVHPPPD